MEEDSNKLVVHFADHHALRTQLGVLDSHDGDAVIHEASFRR